MTYFAGHMHMDPDLIIASGNQMAALGALALFCAEGLLLALFAWPRHRRDSVTPALPKGS